MAMTEEPARFTVKEGTDGKPFLMLEPGNVILRFYAPVTHETAEAAARSLNSRFRITIEETGQ